MLPLGGKSSVSGGHGPAVTGIQLGMSLTRVDHGLDRERHSFFEHHARAGTTVMQNLWLLMKYLSNAVPSISNGRTPSPAIAKM